MSAPRPLSVFALPALPTMVIDDGADRGSRVTVDRRGSPLEPRNVKRSWTRCKKTGVRQIEIHDTRRTCRVAPGRPRRPPARGYADSPA
jgi:hypothetical protein